MRVMPLKINHNTKYAPFKIGDLINRGVDVGAVSLLNDNLTTEIDDDFIFYLTQKANYHFISGVEVTDILTAHIYEFFKDRVILEKYSDAFYDWDEFTDFEPFVDMVKATIENTIITNAEKYKKLYKAMTVDFNPLWNVDGIETTERELTQTGTNTNNKTGKDTTVDAGGSTSETATTDSTATTGTDTDTTQKTTYNESTFYDTEKLSRGKNTSVDGEGTSSTEDTHENTSETTYNTKDENTRNLKDVERTVTEKHGNIGVTTTTKLLTEFVEYASIDLTRFLDVVSRDVVNSFTYMVY